MEMDEFNTLILASFTDAEVDEAVHAAQVEILQKAMNHSVDNILSMGCPPEALIEVLRVTAEDLQHAYDEADDDE